jgi:hypothetical protein
MSQNTSEIAVVLAGSLSSALIQYKTAGSIGSSIGPRIDWLTELQSD